ncbi:hypothetical protein OsJ_12182 [Oryza sativa Japonica Group]|uniref:Uncharacterized protein n=3 Tax=Oryza TaxID=4527 RepID=A3ALM1_ORYSJ|nr:hypothetical protein [Oryza sativa Japonica Group]ABF98302.1 hypothetical protein LOC_Os03g48580 [Oryza sativa Japonica Group]EAZ28210.1 hypothetical protein OsJ_12182 [Oryza sativa Japonica Group]
MGLMEGWWLFPPLSIEPLKRQLDGGGGFVCGREQGVGEVGAGAVPRPGQPAPATARHGEEQRGEAERRRRRMQDRLNMDGDGARVGDDSRGD